MNPFLLIALGATLLGVGIEMYNRSKNSDTPPEVKPDATPPGGEPDVETVDNVGSGGPANGADSGAIPTPEVADNSGKPSINLDNE